MLDHLPERDRSAIERRLRAAWEAHDHRTAIERLQTLAGELARSQPGAAASLREGLTETVTCTASAFIEQLWKPLSSTDRSSRRSRLAALPAAATSSGGKTGDMCLALDGCPAG